MYEFWIFFSDALGRCKYYTTGGVLDVLDEEKYAIQLLLVLKFVEVDWNYQIIIWSIICHWLIHLITTNLKERWDVDENTF